MPSAPDLAALRTSYERGELDESTAADDPLVQFDRWLREAIDAGVPEPTAMTLATVGEDARPSTRIVLLKGFDVSGFVWYTNHLSRKGRELAANPNAALQFHWVALERVVRIEGVASHVDDATSDAYFASRPLASRIGAWASPQSQPIASRTALAAWVAQAADRHGPNPPRPPHWGGWRLLPSALEFWQGRRDRLHDRLRWTRESDGAPAAHAWRRERLAP